MWDNRGRRHKPPPIPAPSRVLGAQPPRGYSVSPCSGKRWRADRWDNRRRHRSPSGVQGAQPPPGVQRVPLFWNTSQGRAGRIAGLRAISPLSSLPQAGCRGAAPSGGTEGVPLFLKTLEGGAGGIAALAKPDPPLKDGAGHNKTLVPRDAPPLQNTNYCAIVPPMKWATGPLLFLGACRITYVLGANHRESPCGRSAEGTTQGARPSEEGWDRSDCRCKAQAPWSHPTP